ncbi:MAG: catechol 2,3-dioxygenase [Anaerolineae bacterium]
MSLARPCRKFDTASRFLYNYQPSTNKQTMTQPTISPDTTLGYVHLTVTNLDRSLAFYRESLGFQLHRRDGDTAALGAGRADLLRLTENPRARRVSRTTGLYHFAILVPGRVELAQVLRRIAETQTMVQGFADHGVSEAIYLPDPDGNGIEMYRDRPRAEWPIRNGELAMVTDPLDTHGLLRELVGLSEPWAGLPAGTVLGHMHLHVSNLNRAELFYKNIIGFELMQHFGGSAAFLSAGGYHHHLGLNIWNGVGAPQPPPDAVGLRCYVIELPAQADVDAIADRARAADVPLTEQPDGLLLRDPAGNGVVIKTRNA